MAIDASTNHWLSFVPSDKLSIIKQDTECPICLEPSKLAVITTCFHVFCRECINQVINSSNDCPLCRKKIVIKNANPFIAVTKKILGLGTGEGIDALKSIQQVSLYIHCRTQIQKIIMESLKFNGPWGCIVPNISLNIILRLRHQLELRGFGLAKVFKIEGGICLEVVHSPGGIDDIYKESNGWDPNFSSQNVIDSGRRKLEEQNEKVNNNSNLTEEEKIYFKIYNVLGTK